MSLTDPRHAALVAALESRGWVWRDEFIYAPHSTMWLLRSTPWVGDLTEFHERMSGRLQRNEQAARDYDNPQDHQNLVDDTRSLVEALAALIANDENDRAPAAAGVLEK